MLPFIQTTVVRKAEVKVRHFRDPEMLSNDHEGGDNRLFNLKLNRRIDLVHWKEDSRAVNNLGEHKTFVR